MESDLSVLQDPEFLIFALSQVSESERPSVLNSIGAEFLTRLELKGSLDDLLHAIKIEEKALEAAPGSSPFRTIILNSLVYRLRMKFERMGSMEDLNRAIETIEQAVQSIPLDYPDMAMCLNNLGNTLKKRFVRTGSMEDLNRAIEIYNQTVQSTSTDDSDRFAMYLNNLGAALRLRFERNGSIEDLNHAVKTTRQAVQLTALGDPRKAMYLSNLGTALRNRFERTGSIEDLNCAIKTNHQAVQLVPPDHFSQGGLLNNLGNALLRRSMTTGSMNDLDHAIDTIDQAVQSTPLDHPALAMHYLNNLGIAVHRRFERTRSLEDLDRAIKTNEQAVHLLPVDHHNWAIFVNNLSSTLLIERFERLGLIEDLDRAIEASEKAVQSVPLDHPQRASCLNQLGNALHRRSKMGATVDLDRAIQTEDRAVQSMALEHPDRAMYLYNLGRLLQSRFESSGSIEDLEGSILAYKQAANSDKAPPFDRLKAGWVCANFLLGQRMLERAKPILEAAVNLLPHLAPRLLKRTDAQFNVSEFANVTARAVSLSVEYDTDDPWKSLQLLELGRGILANLQLEVRSDISALETNHPELARQFQELRDQIDSISKTFEPDGQSICGINSTSDMSETFISYSRRLHQQFDDLVVHIRGLQGFDNFLKGPSEKELRSLAKGGAIVVFNISDIRSDAFLITTDGIRVVNLPLLTSDAILSYATLFLESIDEQDGIQYSRTTRKINSVLKGLWDCGVKAILDELGFTEVPADGQPWPRIWWVGSEICSIFFLFMQLDTMTMILRNESSIVLSHHTHTPSSLSPTQGKRRLKWLEIRQSIMQLS